MGVLEVAARIVELGGAPARAGRVAELRAAFEARTGSFVPEDPWFEERSRAFWEDAVTAGRFGRAVEPDLTEGERAWLGPIERAHRGLFRAVGDGRLVDAWSGAEFRPTLVDELATRAELEASVDGAADNTSGALARGTAGRRRAQLFDGRVVAVAGEGGREPSFGSSRSLGFCVALLPGPVFHPRDATEAIEGVLRSAREREMRTGEVLDALLRMQRTLRSLSRVKAAYAYRPESLEARPTAPSALAVRRVAKTLT